MLPTINSKRLVIRPFTQEDAKNVQILAGHPEIARSTLHIPHPYEDGVAEAWIASHEEVAKSNNLYNLAIIEKDSNTLVGAYSVGVSRGGHKAEVGYWVGVPYWGLGYCSEATEVMVAYCFNELKVNKVYGRYFVTNPASGRVMEKVGMVFEGVLREDVKKDNTFIDVGFRSLLRREYFSEDK